MPLMEAYSEQNTPISEKTIADQLQEDASEYCNCPIIGKISKRRPSESQCPLALNSNLSQECMQTIEQSKCPLSTEKAEQIAIPATPFWYDKYGAFFSLLWCPLYGKIPESFKDNHLTTQCVQIIEESRKIWQCFPQSDLSKYPVWKLKLAQEIWKLFCTHFENIFQSQTYKEGTVDFECLRIINWTRKNPILELKEITDSEMVALFAIYVTWRALEDWLIVEKGESLAYLYPPFDEYSFVKEKMRIALLVLSEAKKTIQTQEKVQRKHASDKPIMDNVFRWCGGTWEIIYDGETIRPTNSKGLRYIHYLMHHPGKRIHVLELVQIGENTQSKDNKQLLIEKSKRVETKGLNESSHEDDVNIDILSAEVDKKEDDITDHLSVKEYKRCMSYLNEQEEAARQDGDIDKLREIQDKIAKIKKILKASQSKEGRIRKLAGTEEKIRKSVRKCIKESLDMIQKEHSALYAHLKSPIVTTGTYCQYNPLKEIPWKLK